MECVVQEGFFEKKMSYWLRTTPLKDVPILVNISDTVDVSLTFVSARKKGVIPNVIVGRAER